MTSPYRAMCAELLADYEQCRYRSELHDRARALLDQPVAEGPTDDGEVAELVEWLRESLDCALQSGNSKSIKNHCRLLDLLGRPTPQPVAEGPTDEEIEEWADACPEAPLEEMDPEVHGWRRCFTAKEFSETIRAALDRWGRPTPQPVAVSERLPGPEDCIFPTGECWWFDPHADGAWYVDTFQGNYTHWLSANALPTPEAKP